MTTSDYFRVLRKRWRVATLAFLVVLGVALALDFVQTPKYSAKAQLYVAASNGSLQDLVAGTSLGQSQVQSYVQFIDSPQVTDVAAQRLHDGLSGTALSNEITATAPLGTQLINLEVDDKSAQRAAAAANAVSDVFATYASALNNARGLRSAVKITVVRRAVPPPAPSSPRLPLYVIIGVVGGLIVGALVAFAREGADRTVASPDQLADLVGVPVVGVVAHDPEASSRPLVVSDDPRSMRAEAIRQLRTNLQFVDVDQRPRSIAVTSSVPSEGKTTTAVNLAIALADTGTSVCLLEGDLRRPKAADYLGLQDAVGVTDVLIGRLSLDDVLQDWGAHQKLRFVASGPLPPNPSELLASHGMERLLQQLQSRFDMVIVDCPPLLPVTDGALLSNLTSGAIVVVRHGRTRRDQVERAMGILRGTDAHVYGTVLTFTPRRGPDAYYYGYGYRYDRKGTRESLDSPILPDRADPPTRSSAQSQDERPGGMDLSAAGSPADSSTPTTANGADQQQGVPSGDVAGPSETFTAAEWSNKPDGVEM